MFVWVTFSGLAWLRLLFVKNSSEQDTWDLLCRLKRALEQTWMAANLWKQLKGRAFFRRGPLAHRFPPGNALKHQRSEIGGATHNMGRRLYVSFWGLIRGSVQANRWRLLQQQGGSRWWIHQLWPFFLPRWFCPLPPAADPLLPSRYKSSVVYSMWSQRGAKKTFDWLNFHSSTKRKECFSLEDKWLLWRQVPPLIWGFISTVGDPFLHGVSQHVRLRSKGSQVHPHRFKMTQKKEWWDTLALFIISAMMNRSNHFYRKVEPTLGFSPFTQKNCLLFCPVQWISWISWLKLN